jgi:predicted 3-demethylubiquinone-9 3-methyltransferase (glyoxalase superfamily)
MQKIDPFLWFDNQAEEAVNYYISAFSSVFNTAGRDKKSNILNTSRYGDAGPGPAGGVMIQTFQLIGHEIIALNGGPNKDFIFNKSISFFVNCKTDEEINKLFQVLSFGGEILMPLDKYPFSEKFVWFNDMQNISWQLNKAEYEPKITPLLWFEDKAEEAMNYYCSVFSGIVGKGTGIKHISRFGENENGPIGKVKHATFTINGQEFMAMDSNKERFSPAISFLVNCETQKEVDVLWEKLSKGGQTSQCGWLTDQFGVTWQIFPIILGKLMSDPDKEKSQRVMKAMLKMTKLESEVLKKAYEQG